MLRQSPESESIVHLLIATALYELKIKTEYKVLIDAKDQRYEGAKQQALTRVKEMANYFSNKHQQLEQWFTALEQQLRSVSLQDSAVSSPKLSQLVTALEDVE
mmetsp:Transcript_3507/g.2093  ORF Transcript_3507/g.2093 Transcript_3507/m.2093 type:complete len:103 (-) Transcript_3507:108-416(-)